MEMLQKLFFIFKFPNTILFLKLIEKYLWKPCRKGFAKFFSKIQTYDQMSTFTFWNYL